MTLELESIGNIYDEELHLPDNCLVSTFSFQENNIEIFISLSF